MANVYEDWSATAGNNTAVGGVSIAEGMAVGSVNNAMRAMMADVAAWAQCVAGARTTTGTANARVLSSGMSVAGYSDGLLLAFQSSLSNTGATTINVDANGTQPIKTMGASGSAALAANALRAGGVYLIAYSETESAFILANPSNLLPLSGGAITGNLTVVADVRIDGGNLYLRNTDGTNRSVIATSSTDAAFVSWIKYDEGGNQQTYLRLLPDDAVTSGLSGTAPNSNSLINRARGDARYVQVARTITAGTGLSGGGDLSADRTLAVDSTVVRTTGNQSMSGNKTFTGRVLLADGSASAPSLAFSDDGNVGVYRVGADTIGITTAGSTRVKIDADGRLLVGSAAYSGTDPSEVGVSIQGAGASSPGAISATVSGSSALSLNRRASNGDIVGFYRQDVLRGSISITTTAVAYNTTSDARRKENPRDFDSGAIIDALPMQEFDWKAEYGGGSAHGVLVDAETAATFPAAFSFDEDHDIWTADYSKLVPVLWRELRSIRTRLAAVETQSG